MPLETGLHATGLSRSYGAGAARVSALDDVNVHLHTGRLAAIVGPSGSGKSTLLNVLGGMDTPDAGHAALNGIAFTGMGSRKLTEFRRNHVGFVFQFYNLLPQLTALENVELARRLPSHHGVDVQTSAQLLDRVGLGDRADHFPQQLSGGQMQRVSIARALAKRPALLLCDEPTGALDSASGVEVMTLLIDIAREGLAVVAVVTHDPTIRDVADHVVEMRDGRVVADSHPPVS
ncbi:ABC transporter ATP-binding protein [Microbacterium trichothecenolyticum]|uniref:ABC transport system ATP-binding protein n=1 Tax=Microbacterium trichothecenolyticum TaxID=69370 RepID=A0ABU0TXG3_MICTR|nr:ABC transporter ATP-binding protein [Microbacterium trichothecenolyticum]MDQ1123632.1 putative ABC transport system ATP-binding protein [Microbacterium trichothecenolyticum]